MSLLRACKRVSLPAQSRLYAPLSVRGAATGSTPAESSEKQTSDIVPVPPRDVMVADVISGAPCKSTLHCYPGVQLELIPVDSSGTSP